MKEGPLYIVTCDAAGDIVDGQELECYQNLHLPIDIYVDELIKEGWQVSFGKGEFHLCPNHRYLNERSLPRSS